MSTTMDRPGRPAGPYPTAATAVSASQRMVAVRAGRQVLLGGPGTGKTTTVVDWAVRRVGPTSGPVVLVPSRRAADRVRDAVESRAAATTADRVARTPHSMAWSVLREHALRAGHRPPRLATASEQDETIAELLTGHEQDGRTPSWPARLDAPVRRTRAFRDELRELSARLVEHGLRPEELLDLGERYRRPEWCAAAAVLLEVEQVAGLRGEDAHDPASIVTLAADLVADPASGMADWVASQVAHLAVDDAQDLTPAAWSFVRELADVTGDLLVVGDPDGATQAFRGARPVLLEQAPGWLGGPSSPVHLTRWARPAAQATPLTRVSALIGRELHGGRPPAWSPASLEPASLEPGGGDPLTARMRGSVTVRTCLDPADEAAVVVSELRRRRHRSDDAVPWSAMAVVVRSVRGADQLRRTLDAAGVAVRAPGVREPLRDDPVVALLLLALEVCADPERLDPVVLERLVVGPLGGGDPVRWRRLVLQARQQHRPASGGISGAEAVAVVCGEVRPLVAGHERVPSTGAPFAGLGAAVAAPLLRVVDVLAAGGRAVPAGIEETLWQVWDRWGVAESWRRTALRGGPDGARADADLDAVMGLFATAASWLDRQPRGDVAEFVRHVRSRALGDDRLGGDGPPDAVTVTTPAGAVGERWRVVVVAGVQDGSWPDPRVRGSLLGLTDLVDVLRGRDVPVSSPSGPPAGDPAHHAELRRGSRRDVLMDELRLFHVAVSRAEEELVVTASDGAQQRPSDLVELVRRAIVLDADTEVDVAAGTAGVAEAQVAARAGTTLAELTASLRRALVGAPVGPAIGPPCEPATAARLLARLAAAGVRGADPAEWSWLPSARQRPDREVAQVAVSPSGVERFLRCPLQWYLTSSGGTVPRETAQGLGALVHTALERVPDADVDGLARVVDSGWADLELGDGWVSTFQRGRVETMLRKLAVWAADQRTAGHRVLAVEAPFRYDVDDVTVRGTIDRVEAGPGGGIRVVDLKTGRTAPSATDTADNPQLQLYQLAVAVGAVPDVAGPPAGALLLHVGTDHAGACERRQSPPDDEALQKVRDRVRAVGAGMRAQAFVARPGTACPRCPVRGSCPTTPEGRRTPPPEPPG